MQQVQQENHLRWDSLGEFFAIAESFRHFLHSQDNQRAGVLADTLDRATETFLNENRSPSRKVGEIDNRGSHFYLTLYWAEELAKQSDDAELAKALAPIAEALRENEAVIAEELLAVQGQPVDLNGYYNPADETLTKLMRPSQTFNAIIDKLG